MIRRSARLAAGFTLVELLICISIIGILAALVSSQVATALDRGKTTACLSNLRQIGLAIQSYISDHNNNLPALTSGRSLTSQNVPVMDTVLLPYTGNNTAVFHCPADTTNYQSSGDSYFWNYLPTIQPDGTTNLKYSSLNFQMLDTADYSQIPLVTDKEAFHHSSNSSTTNNRVQNVLYADGHANGT